MSKNVEASSEAENVHVALVNTESNSEISDFTNNL